MGHIATRAKFRGAFQVPISFATLPIDGEVLTDRWWVVRNEHDLMCWTDGRTRDHISPQCNQSEFTASELMKRTYPGSEYSLCFIPLVFVGRLITTLRAINEAEV